MPRPQLASLLGQVRFRIRYGVGRRQQNPLFDEAWYTRMNPDVAETGMDPYRHYRVYGAREGRDPSPFLDRDWYLRTYPDVAATGMDPIDHYYLYGAREGRDPCPSFHTACYLADHPDVLVSGMNPLEHYQLHGIGEGRRLCRMSHGELSRLTPQERYGELLDVALEARSEWSDVIWFGIIDWEFRVQRPQHLASVLADAGHRIVYVSPRFDPEDGRGGFTIVSNPRPGVFQVRLKLSPPLPSLYEGLRERHLAEVLGTTRELAATLTLRNPVAVLDFPAWRSAAMSIPGATIVMDCLDHVAGFSNVSDGVVEEERCLLAQADVVIASSQRLADTLGQTRSATLIRNGADTELFSGPSMPAATGKAKGGAPTVGYFGAIEEWFEMDWIAHAARSRPDWQFVLIGRSSRSVTAPVANLGNVKLLGEQPYEELPAYLHGFDVAIIPFKLTELTQNVNPVKLYEYLSAGVPVVASPLSELEQVGDVVYLATDREAFVAQIERALQEDDAERRENRRQWASAHDWARRGEAFRAAIARSFVKVSVVVLCYNGWEDTKACLESILTLSEYPDEILEVIAVDNASTDGTAEGLEELRRQDTRLHVIRNADNLGFAGGNNVGIRAATGDVIVLINNDTYVTRGWLRRLIRPLLRDDHVGLSGPLTNNIGNEQKVALRYETMEQMEQVSSEFTDGRLGETFETNNLAFFCVAIRRDVIDDVGLLDEDFGIGMFEDDDYCRRAARRGWRMVIADDAFVHHRLSAAFDALGDGVRSQLFEQNKQIYEKKWGPWIPHRYRDAPGFGA